MDKNEVKKDLYKSKNMAKLSHYVSGNLYYNVELTDGTYQFPIATVEYGLEKIDLEISHKSYIEKTLDALSNCYNTKFDSLTLSEDLGTTTFESEMKGSDLNRWISKAIDKDEFVKIK